MWINGLTDQFTRAEYADKRLLLFQQIPPAKPMGPTLLNSDPSNSRFDLNSVQDRNKLISSEVDELSSYENITTLDPAETLCPNGMCFMNRDNKPVYSDQFHLSPDGAMMLEDDIRRAISDLIKRP